MLTQEIHIKIATQTGQLAAVITKPRNGEHLPAIVFLTGSGGTKERFQDIQYFFSNRGYYTLAFDFRGRGDSDGEKDQNTLKDQKFDVKHIFSFLTYRQPIDAGNISLFGTSMGAFVAATICDELSIKNLILSAPALYMPEHELLPQSDINHKADQIIKEHQQDYLQANPFIHIPRYKGNLLVLQHEYDDVIPSWLCHSYFKSFTATITKKYLLLKEVDHPVLRSTPHKKLLSDSIYSWLQELDRSQQLSPRSD